MPAGSGGSCRPVATSTSGSMASICRRGWSRRPSVGTSYRRARRKMAGQGPRRLWVPDFFDPAGVVVPDCGMRSPT